MSHGNNFYEKRKESIVFFGINSIFFAVLVAVLLKHVTVKLKIVGACNFLKRKREKREKFETNFVFKLFENI